MDGIRSSGMLGWVQSVGILAALACSPAPPREPGQAGGSSGSSSLPSGGTAGMAVIGIETGGAAGRGSVDACVAETSMAQPAPLDIYLMLDISGSMLDSAGAGQQKWTAVKSAITEFLRDPGSASIGVGIQYYPLRKPDVPAMCTDNAECGSGGSCLLKTCAAYSFEVPGGVAQCDTDDDCRDIPAAIDYGPCEGTTCKSSATVTCTRNSDCLMPTTRDFGPCEPFGQCEDDRSLICPLIGASCDAPGGTTAFGNCVGVASSFCFHGSQCESAAYATPAVPIAPLAESAEALIASIESQAPDGDTPSGPALRGAIQHAREWAGSHPGHAVVTVLATDGLPSECLLNEQRFSGTVPVSELVHEVAAIAADGAQGSPSVPTFVIGVFSPTDLAAPDNLRLIAEAGGTQTAQIVDASGDVTQQFLRALNAIRKSRLACEYQIPAPEPGQTLDFLAVNVDLVDAGTSNPLYYVRTPDQCDGEGGWYYDDQTGRSPTKILVCPSTCDRFQNAGEGAVQIKLGCETRVR